MKELFLLIQAKLISVLQADYPEIYIRVWNNQFSDLTSDDAGSLIYPFPFPCVFVEFITDEIQQLGQGYQIYDPLTIRLHIGYWELDSIDGNMEQNLNVFDFKQKIFLGLNKFQCAGSGIFVRGREEQDYSHKGIYKYIQDYETNYVDQIAAEPVGGVENTPPVELDLTVTYDPSPITKTIP